MAVQLAPHGAWESPITVEHVAGGDGRPSHLGLVGEEVWWTEPRPSEDGRRTLMRRSEDGSVASVLPAPSW